MSEDDKGKLIDLWLPFKTGEISFAIGVLTGTYGLLTRFKVPDVYIITILVVLASTVYLAGLLVYHRREGEKFRFVPNGGESGQGYAPFFRGASESLLLTHVDDDHPSDECVSLFDNVLRKGGKVRRLVFLREDAPDSAYTWIKEKCSRPGDIEHRAILPEDGMAMRFSFIVVDQARVVISVPGYETFERLDSGFILRHGIVIHDQSAAKVFTSMYFDLWNRAYKVEDLNAFSSPSELIRSIRQARQAANETMKVEHRSPPKNSPPHAQASPKEEPNPAEIIPEEK